MFVSTTRHHAIAPRALPGRALLLLALSLALLPASATLVEAADKATVVGKVLDSDGKPLVGVSVTIRGAEFEHTATTNKKGRFKASVPDASVPYEIHFDREGYPVFSQTLTFPKGGSYGMEWKLTAPPLGSPTDSAVALASFNAGAKAHEKGDLDLALREYGAAVGADPEFAEAHAVLANIHLAREDHEQASLAAERALALQPDNISALRSRYLADLELGREGASATLDRLAELDPTPRTAVLLYNEGVAARGAGDRERALARYELVTRIDPTFVGALGALAGLQLALKDYDAALRSTQRLLELDAADARGLSVRYNTFIALGRNDEAQEMLEALQQAAPDAVAEAYFERGAALFDDDLIDQAIPALEQALEADPDHPRGHYTLGLCYMNRGRNEEARRHLERFVELAPDDPDADAARQLIEVLAGSE